MLVKEKVMWYNILNSQTKPFEGKGESDYGKSKEKPRQEDTDKM